MKKTKIRILTFSLLALAAIFPLAKKAMAQVPGWTAFPGIPPTNGGNFSTNFVGPWNGTNATTSMIRVYNANQVGFFVGGASLAGSNNWITSSITVYRSQDAIGTEVVPWFTLTYSGGSSGQTNSPGTNGVPGYAYTFVNLAPFQYFWLGNYTNNLMNSTNNAAGYLIKPPY